MQIEIMILELMTMSLFLLIALLIASFIFTDR